MSHVPQGDPYAPPPYKPDGGGKIVVIVALAVIFVVGAAVAKFVLHLW